MGFFDSLFGTSDKAAGRDAQQGAITQAKDAYTDAKAGVTDATGRLNAIGDAAQAQGAQYDQAAQDSMGANAGDMLAKSQAASSGLASQTAAQQASGATQQALQAARTSGMNKAQSAAAAGQLGAQNYTQGYGQQLNNNMNMYNQNTAQIAGQGNAMANRGLSAAGTAGSLSTALGGVGVGAAGAQSGAGAALTGAGQKTADSTVGAIGGLAGALGGIFSDENLKTKIKNDESLHALIKATHGKGSSFEYKNGSVADDGGVTHVGVMAQQLEETPMKDNVIDTPNGKMIDAAKQTMSNTALIAELGKKQAELEAFVKSLKGRK